MKGKAVLVLGGLGDARAIPEDMARFLHDRGGYMAQCVAYPSLFDEVGEHAKSLDSVVRHLDGVEEINFVGHSLGNLVIRRYLGDQTNAAKGKTPDKRIKRIVMLGPPNQGAELAEKLGDYPAFIAAFGESGQQLGKRWKELKPTLATPECEFGIIAGGRGDGHGYNPLLSGDNDGIVTVASTRLAGARFRFGQGVALRPSPLVWCAEPYPGVPKARLLRFGGEAAADQAMRPQLKSMADEPRKLTTVRDFGAERRVRWGRFHWLAESSRQSP